MTLRRHIPGYALLAFSLVLPARAICATVTLLGIEQCSPADPELAKGLKDWDGVEQYGLACPISEAPGKPPALILLVYDPDHLPHRYMSYHPSPATTVLRASDRKPVLDLGQSVLGCAGDSNYIYRFSQWRNGYPQRIEEDMKALLLFGDESERWTWDARSETYKVVYDKRLNTFFGRKTSGYNEEGCEDWGHRFGKP